MHHESSILLICRPEFTDTLLEESASKCEARLKWSTPAPGLVLGEGITRMPREFIFERQRLVDPVFIPAANLKPLGDATVQLLAGPLIQSNPLWAVHFIIPEAGDADGEIASSKRLEGIWNTAVRLGKKRAPDIEKRMRASHRLKTGGIVVQLLLTTDGLWSSHEKIESMLNPRAGGFSRMKWDPLAPSRSYLKMEEALDRMPDQPAGEQKVIDLGAAPGGWTYSFLKRGCNVIAVDHGPMKLPEPQPGWGRMTHIQQNGITYEPPREWPRVDWLVGDMLIAPGIALGLLRRWIDSERANRIICNIKLPQEHPYGAVQPVEDFLQRQKKYTWSIKQLYHDRREVTVMAHRAPAMPLPQT